MSENQNKNVPQNNLFNIPAIPTFGIYDFQDYLLMQQIHIQKSQKLMPDNLPSFIIDQLKKFSKDYPKIIPEFYHITLNAYDIYSKFNERIIESDYVRINLVAHPYIFNNSKITKNSKTHINCAIFTFNEEVDKIIESNNEPMALRINPPCEIMNQELNRDIILNIEQKDKKYNLEPNNCAFLINLNKQIINFYCIVIGTHYNSPTKCFIGNYVIISNGFNNLILNSLTQKMFSYNNNQELFFSLILAQRLYNDSLMFFIFYILNEIKNKSKASLNIEQIKDLVIKSFKVMFEFNYNADQVSKKEHDEDLNNIGKHYFNHIKNYINYIYDGSSIINNFSEKIILCSLNNNYIIEILLKYIDFHLSLVDKIIYSYFNYFSDNIDYKKLNEDALKEHKTKIWPKYKEHYCKELKINLKDFDKIIMPFIDKNRKKVENRNIKLFQNICNGLLEQKDIQNIFEQIDEPIKEYFYYYVWVYKGKLNGIHKDFGRHSFMCSDKIKKIYHCNIDEKYDFCEKMKQVLIDADAQYNQQK